MNSNTTTYTDHTFTTSNVFLQHYKNDQNPTRPNHVLYMYVTPEELANVPASFFMVKELTRQSGRPGTIVFKFFRLDVDGNLKFPSKDIPNEFAGKITLATDLDDVKKAILALVAQHPDAHIQFEFPVQGTFANVETPNDPSDSQYLLYDVEQFPDTFGAPSWFLNPGTEFKVTATGSYSKKYSTDYYQITIATDATADEAFTRGATRGATPIFDGGHTPIETTFEADASQASGSLADIL